MSDTNEDETLSFFHLISSYLTKVLCHQTPRKEHFFFFFFLLSLLCIENNPFAFIRLQKMCFSVFFLFYFDTVLIEFLKRIHLILCYVFFLLNELMCVVAAVTLQVQLAGSAKDS